MNILLTGGSGFIGTNLVDHLSSHNHTVANLDIAAPQKIHPAVAHYEGSIMDEDFLRHVLDETQPDAIIHLAARTDTDSNELDDYAVNSEGTRRVCRALTHSAPNAHLIHTSTQFVARPGVDVSDPEAFDPHTTYGKSKVLSEQIVREELHWSSWTIVRPTNIWGPWHPRYPLEFWHVLDRGWYLHPGGRKVTRTYGYIGNVVQQYRAITEAPVSQTDHQVLYLGDPPTDLEAWANHFSLEITGRPVRHVPHPVLKGIASLGDAVGRMGRKFPLTTSRLTSMTQDYVVPTDAAVNEYLPAPISMEEGVRETVAWLRSRGLLRAPSSARARRLNSLSGT